MGTTISFILCLLSGLFAFWLFWKCVDWFEKERDYVHNIISIRYSGVRVLDVCAFEAREVLRGL